MQSKLTKFIASTGALALVAPIITFAQVNSGSFQYEGSVFQNAILFIQKIIAALFPVITAALVLYFAYEVFKFIRAEGDEKAKLRTGMIQAIIGLVVWFALFGIINAIAKTFNLGVGTKIETGQIPGVEFPV